MRKVCLIVLTLLVAACMPGAATGAPATTVPSVISVPGASVPCIDRGQLADNADTVFTTLQGLIAALKIPDVDQARSLAGSTASGMRSAADLVSPVRPDAAKDFRSAADELDKATPQFPGGVALVDQAQTEWGQGMELARAGVCPD